MVADARRPSRSSDSADAEAAKRKQRKEKKVSAILHESVPVRFWDHDLGPDAPRLFAGSLADAEAGDEPSIDLTDLTPEPGQGARRGAVRRQPGRLDRRRPPGRCPSAAASGSASR